MSEPSAKQQIVDKLRDVDTLLVTVNSNPTVDELSAALGFTLLVNKLNKHATAVFSGSIPPAITFLDPEKTFSDTADSLRDFIIALDKEKADHLRYKVEGDMVKIFITPYKTTIDERDLDFSQGDYNVEMVVALGVQSTDDLDKALADHGRIMHDATVSSISIGSTTSQLGSINWHDDEASSYSELLVGLSESLRSDKNLIDEQIATAFLTGIVAATDRFSNQSTSSKTMTIAAQLMAAGANQQLIATKLEQADALSVSSKPVSSGAKSDTDESPDSDRVDIPRDKPESKSSSEAEESEPELDRQAADGTMAISHEKKGDLDEVADQVEKERQTEAAKKAEEALAESLAVTAPAAAANIPTVADLQQDLQNAATELNEDTNDKGDEGDGRVTDTPPESPLPQSEPAGEPDGFIETPIDSKSQPAQYEPTLGGTLNATSEQAAEDKRRELESDRNRTILSHDSGPSYAAGQPNDYPAVNSFSTDSNNVPTVEPLPELSITSRGQDIQPPSNADAAQLPVAATPPPLPPLPSLPSPPPPPTIQQIEQENNAANAIPDAQAAIEQALNSAPSLSQQQSQIPSVPPLAPLGTPPPASPPPGLPPLPPLPDFSTLPPLPATPAQPPVLDVNAASQLPIQPPSAPVSNDPGQFQIPGQN